MFYVATATILKFLSLKIMCRLVKQHFWKVSSNSERLKKDMLNHIAIISVCYGGHFESKMTAKIQKSSDLGEIWFPCRL
jgi:hypothetical protein